MELLRNLTGNSKFNTTVHCPSGSPANSCLHGSAPSEAAGDFYHLNVMEDILYIIVTPTLCIFGSIGNIINLIVLYKIRVRMRKVDGGKEGVTNTGLMLLALSDLFFCLSTCPRGLGRLASSMSFFEQKGFWLYYQVYGTGFVTTFILTSTWVTVAIAVLRYIGICHPLATRRMDSRVYGRITYVLVILVSVLVNLPAFWQFKVETIALGPGNTAYLIDIGVFDKESRHGRAFLWVRAVYAVFLPALLLAFCNFSLILTLRRSYQMRRVCRVQDSASRNSVRITLLLVVLVVMFVLLVFPSEVLDFCSENIKMDMARTQTFLVVRALTNVLQVLNFAVNFILYCAMNVHFRTTMRDLFLCAGFRRDAHDRKQFSLMGRSTDNCSLATTTSTVTSLRLSERLTTAVTDHGQGATL